MSAPKSCPSGTYSASTGLSACLSCPSSPNLNITISLGGIASTSSTAATPTPIPFTTLRPNAFGLQAALVTTDSINSQCFGASISAVSETFKWSQIFPLQVFPTLTMPATLSNNGVDFIMDPSAIAIANPTTSNLQLPSFALTPSRAYVFQVNLSGVFSWGSTTYSAYALAWASVFVGTSKPLAIISGGDRSVWFNANAASVVLDGSRCVFALALR